MANLLNRFRRGARRAVAADGLQDYSHGLLAAAHRLARPVQRGVVMKMPARHLRGPHLRHIGAIRFETPK